MLGRWDTQVLQIDPQNGRLLFRNRKGADVFDTEVGPGCLTLWLNRGLCIWLMLPRFMCQLAFTLPLQGEALDVLSAMADIEVCPFTGLPMWISL